MSKILMFMLVLGLLAGCGLGASPPTSGPTQPPARATSTPGRGAAAPTVQPATQIPANQPPAATLIPTVAPEAPAPTQPPPVNVVPTAASEAPTQPTESPIRDQVPASDFTIIITAPAAGTTIQSPVRLAGTVGYMPFERNLGVTVYDSEGNILAQQGMLTEGEFAGPQTFDSSIEWTAPATTQPGKIVVFEASAKDGSIVARDEVLVTLAGNQQSGVHLALPAAGVRVALPLHIEATGVQAGQQYTMRLTYQDGVVLEDTARAVPTSAGGALVANLAWATESAPPQSNTTAATLEIIAPDGKAIASRSLNVIPYGDEQLRPIKLFWVAGEELQEVTRFIPRTEAVATAALRELSWGPAGNEVAAAGFTSLLPSPAQISTYEGRQADWGPRVRLNSIVIKGGEVDVDWSKELAAWGGGAAYLDMMTRQIEQTLRQFPTIQQINMTVDHRDEVLQP